MGIIISMVIIILDDQHPGDHQTYQTKLVEEHQRERRGLEEAIERLDRHEKGRIQNKKVLVQIKKVLIQNKKVLVQNKKVSVQNKKVWA